MTAPFDATASVGALTEQSGPRVNVSVGCTPWFKAVSAYHSFSSGWFSNSRFLDGHMVARGTDDSGSSIADAASINIIPCGGARKVRAIFRWVKDDSSQPSITGNYPEGYMWGFFPYPNQGRPGGKILPATSTNGFANPSDSDVGGIWVPLLTWDGDAKVVWDNTTTFRGAGLGTSSTTANKNAQQYAPIEWMLEGATKCMFLPSGSAAPTFSATPDEAQVIVQVVA